MLGVVLVVVLINLSFINSSDGDGLTASSYPYFSTLTSYDTVRGNFKNMADCKAEKIWVLTRHGTRYAYPNETEAYLHMTKLRDEILENHRTHNRGGLSSVELKSLEEWRFKEKMNQSALMTPSGRREQMDFGRRLHEHFLHLLAVYSPDKVKVRTTYSERTKQSAEAVTEGIWGEPLHITNEMEYNELLKNNNDCPVWRESLNRPNATIEAELFSKGEEMSTVVSGVSSRLGFTDPLMLDDVKMILDLCAYENSWYPPDRSPWCSAFTERHLKVFEYWKDLKHYYKTAHGNPLSMKLACNLIADIISEFESDHQVTLYFGHSFNNRQLLTVLGIGREKGPPTSDKYGAMNDRTWRLSLLNPFGATIVLILNRCGAEKDLMVSVFVSERPYRLEACGNEYSCSFRQFKDFYTNITSAKFCNRDFCFDGQNRRNIRQRRVVHWPEDDVEDD